MKHILPFLTVAMLLAACTQDELTDNTMLPEGMYPLEIASVSLSVEGGEAQPWGAKAPQTRVSENTGGTGSVFMPNDAITVSLGGETATYTYDGSKWTSTAPLYWQSTQTATVNAWYPANGSVNLADQSQGLAYVLKGSGEGSYQSGVSLTFTHQLAKVRVELTGEKASDVTQVEINNYKQCTHTQGEVQATDADKGYIAMYNLGNDVWEANVVPGTITADNFIRLNGSSEATVTGITELTAGSMYTVNLNVKSPVVPSDAQEITGNISGNGNYVVSGTRSEAINITGGSPHIYLDDAQISVSSGPAINITGGTPTIHVTGENTIETGNSLSNYAAGIYVAQGSSVTIEGRDTDDVLRVTGGADGAAIGGYSPALNSHNPCGDITINNVTLYAYASNAYLNNLPIGIGSTGTTACGKIEITDAIVHARGYSSLNESTPAIGAYSGVPQIVISGSTIHAHRGSYGTTSFADYIGRGGNTIEYQGGQIQCGSGSITGSTVYKYSYDVLTGSSSSDGSETY